MHCVTENGCTVQRPVKPKMVERVRPVRSEVNHKKKITGSAYRLVEEIGRVFGEVLLGVMTLGLEMFCFNGETNDVIKRGKIWSVERKKK